MPPTPQAPEAPQPGERSLSLPSAFPPVPTSGEPSRGRGGLALPRHHPSPRSLGAAAPPPHARATGRRGTGRDATPAMPPTPAGPDRSRRTSAAATPRRDRAPHPPAASGRRPGGTPRPAPRREAQPRRRRRRRGFTCRRGSQRRCRPGWARCWRRRPRPPLSALTSPPLRLGSPRRAPPPPPRRCGAMVPPMLPRPAGWGRPRGAGAGRLLRRSGAALRGRGGQRRRRRQRREGGGRDGTGRTPGRGFPPARPSPCAASCAPARRRAPR